MTWLRKSSHTRSPQPHDCEHPRDYSHTPLPQPKLRILCLHGALGSASVLRNQAAPLKSLSAYADLVFIDAPALNRGSRGWFDLSTYAGFDETHAYLAAVVRDHGPFDGVLGLSQGAVLASLLIGLGFFDFSIMFGGFPAHQPLGRIYHSRVRYALPSLHVFGTRDHIVSPDSSRQLASLFVDPKIVVHA
ncbi:hypothetical protein CspeluHIS016_0902740 [Cutaneotrichosporon spelunceum]|uniref:Serine hydrolase domain-containing protein n=1 Tax=Cutaneotrichosporon spelunceum TaxID=1672016 RepID=A0AAD3U0Y6_9TREE|nr:hypothetical protein CspeluHIS016_0902740 [Cutaneotrichosporon spelunceum]